MSERCRACPQARHLGLLQRAAAGTPELMGTAVPAMPLTKTGSERASSLSKLQGRDRIHLQEAKSSGASSPAEVALTPFYSPAWLWPPRSAFPGCSLGSQGTFADMQPRKPQACPLHPLSFLLNHSRPHPFAHRSPPPYAEQLCFSGAGMRPGQRPGQFRMLCAVQMLAWASYLPLRDSGDGNSHCLCSPVEAGCTQSPRQGLPGAGGQNNL